MSRRPRKKAVETTPYHASEELYQALFEQAIDGMFIADAQGRCIEVNRRGCEMLGYTREEMLALSMEDLIPAEELAHDPLRLDELQAGRTVLKERRLRAKDGRLLPVEISVRMLADGSFLGMVRDITERKQTEELLHKREQEFRALVENSPDFIGRYDRDARIIYANPAVERLFGRPLSQLLGKTSVELTPGVKGAQHFYDKIKEVVETGSPVETEIIVDEVPGRNPFYHHLRFVPERDREGQIVSVLFIGRDITSFKEAERQFRTLTEHSPDIIARFDREGRYLYINSAIEKITGIPVQELLGQPIGEILSERLFLGVPEEILSLRQAIQQVFVTGAAIKTEIKLSLPAGEHIFNIRLIPEYNQVREVVSVLHISRDITERKRADEALRASEERYRVLYRENPSMFFTLDAEGTVISLNDFGASQLGYTIDELEGQPVLKVFYEEDKAAVSEQLKICLQNPRQVYHWQFRKVRKDGSLMWVEEFARAVTGPGGVIYVLIVCQDITERKQLEAENEQLAAQFYQAQKMDAVGRLAGGIAHDFNNLLVPIIGYIDLNLMDLAFDSELYTDLLQVRKAAERAADLTQQILAFSRQQVLELSVLDLNGIIDEFKKMLQRLIGEDIELRTVLSSSLHPVKADKGQIEQVLMNLAINSRDAMPEGGMLTIETATVFLDKAYVEKYASDLAPGHYVMLAVSDTGHGMDTETQKRIFDPFFTTKEEGKGTGLGLATVFGIIKQHQGHIWVYSEPGNGTTFKIYLPQAKATVQTTTPITKDPISIYGTETVLVVEDEEMVRRLVCETLEAHGYDIIEAKSPTDCLQLAFGKGKIDLLLTDVIMPEMNGKELYQKLVAIHPNSGVLYMSGYTDNVIVHHGILDEGINFLQKPFTIHNLTRKVREVLNSRPTLLA